MKWKPEAMRAEYAGDATIIHLDTEFSDHISKVQARMTETKYDYAFIDAEGVEQDWTTDDKDEAVDYATTNGLAIIERKYTFEDSELVPQWDFRPSPDLEDEDDAGED